MPQYTNLVFLKTYIASLPATAPGLTLALMRPWHSLTMTVVYDRVTDVDVDDDSIINVELDALNYLATIGVGGFGRVELVRIALLYT